jgi:hypothetical protein
MAQSEAGSIQLDKELDKERINMNSPLDQAITAAAASESAIATDQTNISNIQAAIAAATTPLAPAQAQLVTDVQAGLANYQALSKAVADAEAVLQALLPTQPPPPVPAP